MKQYMEREIRVRILDLLATLDEGWEHIGMLLEELRMEEAFNLLQDMVAGIYSIERALLPLMADEDNRGEYAAATQDLHAGLNETLNAYASRNLEAFRSALLERTVPAQIAWQAQIRARLNRALLM